MLIFSWKNIFEKNTKISTEDYLLSYRLDVYARNLNVEV